MLVPRSNPGSRKHFGAALSAGVLIALIFVTFSWSRLFLTGRIPDDIGAIARGVLTGWVLATISFVLFLLAVLIVVADWSRRAIVGGAGLVYLFDLLLTVGQSTRTDFGAGFELSILAVPLTRVVTLLAIAMAVWVAYHGGYERLVSAAGSPVQHPLLANVADVYIGPDLTLKRGLVAAGLSAIVGAGGLVLAGGIGDILRVIGRSETGRSAIIVATQGQVWNVGIPLARLPSEWLFQTSFLLGVLFVTGPQLRPRDLGKGVAVVFGVQSTVQLLPALIPPFRSVELWGASGPVLMPLGDAVVLFGIAVAVWLAFHDGLEPVQRPSR